MRTDVEHIPARALLDGIEGLWRARIRAGSISLWQLRNELLEATDKRPASKTEALTMTVTGDLDASVERAWQLWPTTSREQW